MKIEKNKIVFGSVLLVVIIFIIGYSIMIFGSDEEENSSLRHTLIPELEQEQEDFKSKLDAVNALKEVRETNIPSIYDERFLDSMGYYDPDLRNKRKEQIVDSIYRQSRITYSESNYSNLPGNVEKENPRTPETEKKTFSEPLIAPVSVKELGLEHQLFYSSNPVQSTETSTAGKVNQILVEVDGEQVVRAGYRLKMRILEDAVVNNVPIAKNTPVYGFISFQPNRALIEIENINHQQVRLKAYDLQDGSEGIYVENSIRADASREVIDDIIQDIDIPGVPQVGGIKKVFQRNNRNIKVTVINNYKLILKASQRQ